MLLGVVSVPQKEEGLRQGNAERQSKAGGAGCAALAFRVFPARGVSRVPCPGACQTSSPGGGQGDAARRGFGPSKRGGAAAGQC
jgi:hypothetical protein